ncbi:hypothetical protein K7432_015811 [Basidiobolus ranarum]|uniref:Uncharacterized protein n=1 Tax=Basidiobolus ranarum TaxID=34480 RepID=A0ABR2VMJ8_9FUNG
MNLDESTVSILALAHKNHVITEQLKADAEYKAAQAQGYAQGAGEKLKGNVKDTVGLAIGNEQMQAEGRVGATKGDIRMDANSN